MANIVDIASLDVAPRATASGATVEVRGVATPTANDSAANKAYVDGLVAALDARLDALEA